MRYVAAYLLATLGGNSNPSASDIKDILSSVGIDVDSERLDIVIKELSGKDINEVGFFWLTSWSHLVVNMVLLVCKFYCYIQSCYF